MLINYLKVALRSIFRNKLTAFINIVGLALAITCALMIYLYVTDEVSYDRYHSKAERIYRITRDFLSEDGNINLRLANVAPPIGPLIKNDFGEVEAMSRTANFGFIIGLEEGGELKKVFTEDNLFLAEPDIFKIFDIDIESGKEGAALERPFTVMLSEKTAKRYFNSTEVIGKRLRANSNFDLEVTGVYKDFPAESHWHPELLVSFSTLNDTTVYGKRRLETAWGNNAFGTYVLLEEGAAAANVQNKLPDFIKRHFGPYAIANWGAPADFDATKSTRLFIEPVTDIHLKSNRADELESNGNANSVYLMAVIGLFIVLIACFNFVNLSTARATRRAKDVGLRKVVGAFRNQLVTQYLNESVLISLFSLLIALALSAVAIQWMNEFTNKQLSLNLVEQWPVLLGVIAFTIVTGLMAGIYPAFIISSYKPAEVLKGQQSSVKGKAGIRKGLVIAQFAISIALMIVTVITFQQLNFLNGSDLGYSKDKVITLAHYPELNETYDAFYNELTKSSSIKNASRSTLVPTTRLLNSSGQPRVTRGDSLVNSSVETKMVFTDSEFFNTYDIDVVAGRSFSKSIKTDDSLAFMINETAAREYGLTNFNEAINKDFHYNGVTGKLIGIVKDFHFESLHQHIVPIVFFPQQRYRDLSVKVAGANTEEALAHLEKVWREFLPNRPFEYQFLSDRYHRLYEAEQKQSQLFTIFSCLAIFIACLGLFGLATFNTLQRVKEIGIRKVLGASVPHILTILSKEIVYLVLIANIIAWPVAWYFMDKWLDSFAYRVTLNPVVFVSAAIAALVIAVLTVSAQTIKAAVMNPTNTLRNE